MYNSSKLYSNILEDFENASPYFLLFLQTVYAIEKLLAGFNWYESVVNLTALSRDAADDVTWDMAFSTFLHSQLKLFDYFCV